MTKTKKTLVAILAVVALLCLAFPMMLSYAADDPTLENDSSIEGFVYGQNIQLPTGKLNYGGKTANAEVTLVFPDGSETTASVIKLDVEGVYTVRYEATIDGSNVSLEKNFTIEKDLFYVSGTASSSEIGSYSYKDHGGNSARDSMKNSSVEGRVISLAAGDVFEYGKVLDLSNKTLNDTIINMVITPENIGTRDVNDFTIILTDAYDPTNYITINTVQKADNSITYTRAAASNGQLMTGWEWNRMVRHANDQYGTPMRLNLAGPSLVSENYSNNNDSSLGINEIKDNAFKLSFDAATLAIHNTFSAHSSSRKNTLIVDFDDPASFDYLWSGFTTGECFLSIKGGSYVGNTFNFVITEIMGSDVNSNTIDDRGNPTIDIDNEQFGSAIPKALVNRAYPIFGATCTSPYFGDLEVVPSVKDASGADVAVTDGKFTPTAAGNYTITYTVLDYFNTKTTKTVTVEAVASLDEITVEISNKTESGVAGVRVSLADVEANGGSGILAIEKKVTLNGSEIPVENDSFFPTVAGTYKVTVTATDYIGQTQTEEYNVTVTAGDKPVYVNPPLMPKYFISGQEYQLPSVDAYDYTDGSGNRVSTKIAYVDSEGTKNARKLVIRPIASDLVTTVDIIYYTNSYDAEGNLRYVSIPLIDIEKTDDSGNKGIDYTKLFHTEEMTVTAQSSYSTFSAKKDGSAELINPQGANGLSIRFQGVSGATFYDGFAIVLTDSVDHSRQLKLIYAPSTGSASIFRLNTLDGTSYDVSQSLMNGDTLAVEYDATTGSVRFDRNKSDKAIVRTYFNGEPFEGFTSGKVYISFELMGVVQESSVNLININGQSFSTRTIDRVEPRITFNDEYLGYREYGVTTLIPKAIATDIVDSYVTTTLTVRTPSGKYAVSTDGVTLNGVLADRDYYLKIEEFGNYVVSFMSVDDSGNGSENPYEYFIVVVDNVKPVITLSGEQVHSGKAGQQIRLPEATATDNIDGEVKVKAFLMLPNASMYDVKEDAYAFTPKSAGRYTIIYTATDSAGNMAMLQMEITVS